MNIQQRLTQLEQTIKPKEIKKARLVEFTDDPNREIWGVLYLYENHQPTIQNLNKQELDELKTSILYKNLEVFINDVPIPTNFSYEELIAYHRVKYGFC